MSGALSKTAPQAPVNTIPLDPGGRFTQAWVQFFQRLSTALKPPTAGATTFRPTGAVLGQFYWDTTLGIPIWWDGAVWVNGAGGVV
jgi:hypothetical protein